MENLIIEPLKGYGDIKFGMSIDEVVNVFGTPSNHEELEPIIDGNEITSVLYDYEDLAVSICFEGTDKMLVSSISTINEDATLFGEKIYEMNRNQIIDLMKKVESLLIIENKFLSGDYKLKALNIFCGAGKTVFPDKYSPRTKSVSLTK